MLQEVLRGENMLWLPQQTRPTSLSAAGQALFYLDSNDNVIYVSISGSDWTALSTGNDILSPLRSGLGGMRFSDTTYRAVPRSNSFTGHAEASDLIGVTLTHPTGTGIQVTRTYRYYFRYACTIPLGAVFRAQVKTYQSSSGTLTGWARRINFNLQKNGASITGVTKANGTTGTEASVSSGAPTIHVLQITPTQAISIAAGDYLEFIVEYELTAGSTSGTPTTHQIHAAVSGATNDIRFEVDV